MTDEWMIDDRIFNKPLYGPGSEDKKITGELERIYTDGDVPTKDDEADD